MQEFLMTTYTIVLPILMGYIVWLLKEQKKARDANCAGTLCLLRDKLMYYHDKYVDKGSIPPYAYENWEKMYKAYKDMGGNGMIVGMNAEIKKLPIEHQEEE